VRSQQNPSADQEIGTAQKPWFERHPITAIALITTFIIIVGINPDLALFAAAAGVITIGLMRWSNDKTEARKAATSEPASQNNRNNLPLQALAAAANALRALLDHLRSLAKILAGFAGLAKDTEPSGGRVRSNQAAVAEQKDSLLSQTGIPVHLSTAPPLTPRSAVSNASGSDAGSVNQKGGRNDVTNAQLQRRDETLGDGIRGQLSAEIGKGVLGDVPEGQDAGKDGNDPQAVRSSGSKLDVRLNCGGLFAVAGLAVAIATNCAVFILLGIILEIARALFLTAQKARAPNARNSSTVTDDQTQTKLIRPNSDASVAGTSGTAIVVSEGTGRSPNNLQGTEIGRAHV
jgi:hypothetical protein